MVLSVFVGSIGLAGAQAAGETLEDGGVYFVGQEVTVNATSGESYTLTDNDGNFVRQYTAGSDGTFVIDTSNLDAGSYNLDGSGLDVSFTVATQDLSAEVSGGELTVDSNRAGYAINVSSEELDDSDIESLLNVSDASNISVDGNSETLELNTSGLDAGSYELNIQVTDTNANATATVNKGTTPGDSVEFEQSVYEVTRGDVGEIAVNFEGNADNAQIQLGSNAVNYNVTLDVTDGDNDGEVVIEFNTYQSTNGSADAFSAADSDDTVTATEVEGNLDEILSSEVAYDLSARLDGEETDVATLAVNDGSIDSFEIGTLPGELFGDFGENDVAAVENASTSTDTIASGDVIVHRLEASGIFGGVQAEGSLGDYLAATGGSVTISQTESGPNANPQSTDLSATDFNVYSDADSGVVYVNVDSDSLPSWAETGETYEVNLTVGANSDLVDEDTTLSATFELVDRTVQFDTEDVDGEDTIVVRAEENATITGTSSVAPGSEFNVRVRSSGDNPFLRTDSVEVQEDGTFAAEFDFSDVSANTTFEASITGGDFDDRPTDVPGVVEPAQRASVNIEDQNVSNGSGQTVTVAAAVLTDGGFVTIHDSTLLDGELFSSVRGTSDYIESTGTDEPVRNVEIQLDTPYNESGTAIAMPHLDTNGNQEYDFVTSEGENDGPYTQDGEAVTDSAELTVGAQNMTNGSAAVTIQDQTTDGSVVTVASATLPEGGFVTIHDSSLQDGATIESVRGTSDYLEAGESTDINVTLDTPFEQGENTVIAMPHMDTNDNQEYDFVSSDGSADGPYTDADGNIVTASATLTVGQGNGTNGTAGTPGTGTDEPTTTAETPSTATTEAPGTSPEPETTAGDGPGFGVIVALVALIGAALLAVRRTN